MFTRYTWSTRDRNSPGLFPGLADGTQSSSQGAYHLTADQAVLGWTRPIKAQPGERVPHRLRARQFLRQAGAVRPARRQSGSRRSQQSCVRRRRHHDHVRQLNTFIGSPNFLPKFQKTQQWQFSDTLSWTRGRHQIKFGTDVHAPQTDNFQDVPGLRGALNFDKIFTCERNSSNQCVANTGIPYADFLYGDPQTAMLSNQFEANQKWYWFDFFAQDDWKVSQRLTLNLGLRYDFSSPVWEGNNHLSNFDPAGAGSIITASSGSLYDRTLVQPQKLNFSPRIGFAYQLRSKTVLRGGYGIYYVPFDRAGSENQLALNPPAFINANVALASTALQPVFPLDSGFPATFLNPADINPAILHIRTTNPDDPRTYMQQWSFGIQRELMKNLFLEADYVGSKGTHILTLGDLNQFINNGQQVTLNSAGQPVLPYPGFGLLEYSQNNANSSYNGLDLTVERRFAAGLSFRLAYTWSKSIDDAAEELSVYGSNAFSQISNNLKGWRGPSDFDVPQRIVFSWVYELPFGTGKRFASSGVAAENLWRLPGRRIVLLRRRAPVHAVRQLQQQLHRHRRGSGASERDRHAGAAAQC